MLEKANQKKGLPKKPLIMAGAVVAAALLVLLGVFVFNAVMNKDNGGGAGQAAVTQVKDTAFDGSKINDADPDAVKQYCEDIKQTRTKVGEGANIRDLCVLDSVAKNWLPLMTSDEIEEMLRDEPTCFETEYDSQGYHCFTGFNKDGCNRAGMTEDGQSCQPESVEVAKDPFSGALPENVCDILQGCQEERMFGPDGFNEFGCDRQGRDKNGDMCPAEYITRIYDDSGRDQLGFDRHGFNEHGCDIRGNREDGTKCSIDEITRVYDKNKRDQFGFDVNGFNENNCNIDGLKPDGTVCAVEDITRIFDPETGLDQFGLDKDGFNAAGCSLEGVDRNGNLCDIEDIPRIFGKDGIDQFGLRKNNRNEHNCDLEGLKPDGSLCPIDELTRIFSPYTGKDQFGFFENGRNQFDCDMNGLKPDGSLCPKDQRTSLVNPKTGLDINNLDADGYAANGCNIEGFRRDGSRCDVEDIPRIFDPVTGLDQFGLNKDGFNEHNCNVEGLRPDGTQCDFDDIPKIYDPETGRDQFGFDKKGFNEKNCDINGRRPDGSLCPAEDVTRIYDPITGADQFGLDKDGFSIETGCDLKGFRRDGSRCDYDDIPKIWSANGINQLGMDKDQRNANGCDLAGRKEDGSMCTEEEMTVWYDDAGMSPFHKNKEGFGRLGFNDLGFNEHNCDINGLKPDGTVCSIDEITRVFDAETGLDQFGLDKDGFNEYGCSLEGLNRNGEKCDPALVPRIFGADGVDQLGQHISELDDDAWAKGAVPISDLKPLLDENGNPVLFNGKPVYVDEQGRLRDPETGLLLTDENGNVVRLNSQGDLVTDGGIVKKGPFKSGTASKAKLTQLLDKDGKPVMLNGKAVYVDEDGFARDPLTGELLLDENGDPIRLDENGNLVSDSGIIKKGPFEKGETITPLLDTSALTPLLDENGNPVMIDGKPVYVDEDGFARDPVTGELLLDEKGNPIRLDENGNLVSDSGIIKKGPFSQSKALIPLLDENGEQVMIDGKPVYVDENGFARDPLTGELILDEEGNPIRLDENGNLVSDAGIVKKGPFAKGKSLTPLLDKNGKPVMIDGKPVYVDENGFARDPITGELLLDENGNPIRLDENGNLVSDSGLVKKGPFSKGQKIKPLVDANGNPVMLDGKPVYVDENGFVRDPLTGKVMLDENGNPIRLDKNGDLVSASGVIKKGPFKPATSAAPLLDENGKPVLINGKKVYVDEFGNIRDLETGEIVTTEDGTPLKLDKDGNIAAGDKIFKKGPFKPSDVTKPKLRQLLDENGKPVMIDGKPVYVDENGFARDPITGELLLDEEGNPIRLDENGNLVSDAGVIKEGPFTQGDLLTPLLDENGNIVMVDGKPAYVDEDGNLRDLETGEIITDKDGNPIFLDENGNLATKDGVYKKGPFTKAKSDADKKRPLLGENGEPVYFDGEQVFVDEMGRLKDKDGNFILGPDGKPLRVNEYGQVVTESGQVIPPSAFTDANGEKMDGAFVAGEPMSEHELAALAAASKLTDAQRKALGLDEFGYNEAGCGLNGLNRQGELCDYDDIPKLIDPETGFDQFGFKDGYNIYGCDIDGKDRQGNACKDEHITRIFDAKGRDQFGNDEAGFGENGLNDEGKNALGCDAMGGGEGCSEGHANKLYDGAGVDQFHKSKDGKDRLGLVNGFNDKGCGLDGLDRLGNRCALEDIPRAFGSDGFDQFGLNEDGYNRFNCNLEGKRPDGSQCPDNQITRIYDKNNLDQFGLTPLRRNDKGCGVDGFTPDGKRCAFEDIPKVVGQDGKDQFGFFADGYNENNCDINGLDREGKACAPENITRIYDPVTGLDQFGLDKDGFNAAGCSLEGVNRDGELCAPEDIPRIVGIDGFDQMGFSDAGFNAAGCDYYGYDKDGELCSADKLTRVFDKKGKDQFGVDKKTNTNENGCGLDGRNKFGKICKPALQVKFKTADGKDQFGFVDGVNENGCDINGLRKDGTRCEHDEITRIIDPKTGLDQLGLDENAINESGCSLDGLKADGTPCDPSDLTHWLDGKGKDQFGLNADKVNDKGCNLFGYKADGTPCGVEDAPAIYGDDGFSQLGYNKNLLDAEGYGPDGLDADGCDRNNMDKDGKRCGAHQDLTLTVEDGEYLTEQRKVVDDWLKQMEVQPTDIGAGTYTYVEPETEEVQAQPIELVGLQNNQGAGGNQPGGNQSGDGGAATGNGQIEIPVGLMALVHVKTPINSDYSQDVYATLLGTAMDGATLKGTIEVPYIDDPVMPRDKFRYVFTSIVWNRKSYPIDAISLNVGDNSGMVSADDVDYHRWQRYGGLVIASAVQALDASFLDSQEQQLLSDQTEQNALLYSQLYGDNTLNLTKQNLQIATSHISDLAKEQFTRRPTIEEGTGQHIIIFRQEVDNDELPMLFSELE